jgi:hypothetical protein
MVATLPRRGLDVPVVNECGNTGRGRKFADIETRYGIVLFLVGTIFSLRGLPQPTTREAYNGAIMRVISSTEYVSLVVRNVLFATVPLFSPSRNRIQIK